MMADSGFADIHSVTTTLGALATTCGIANCGSPSYTLAKRR